jgi:hypothetical protein
LISLDKSIKFLNKLKSIYESIEYPGQVENIRVEISGPTSIAVYFDEPAKITKGFIIKYLGKLHYFFLLHYIEVKFKILIS